jgi:uncharacterized cupin superfamily protein
MTEQNCEELLARAVQGDLSPLEADCLLKWCQEDDALRQRLVRLMQVERLTGLALEEDGGEFSREFRYRLEAEGDEAFASGVVSQLKRGKVVKWISALAALAAMVMLSLFLVLKSGDEIVGEIVRVEAGEFSGDRKELKAGDRVSFDQGLVELRFYTGVRVVIEAPADFEVTGENRGYLHRGKLVAEVDDETAHGFVIDGPSGKLVDLGTKFAVAVEDSGEMEVHVLEGEVDAIATGGETSRLRKDQAMRLADGQASPVEMDSGKFVTRMPDYQDQPSGYVRWSFDEKRGELLKNTGKNLASGNADARLLSHSGKGGGPMRVEGVFGKGLGFDGVDSFVESDFEGIGGSQPRTVAFWVKAPEDFDELQGYGVVSWGDKKVPGGAWQISVNGTSQDGPLGRLRIGTHLGQVIGTTDLRDGEWHHCAVVMYGDPSDQPKTSTHILLYVDGRLEPAARKSMRVVHTVVLAERAGAMHGIWMGRNLGFEHEGTQDGRDYGRVFRGENDEMVICDMAMDQRQILRLMEENEMPNE